jgi:hypothetical protein
MLGSGLTSSSSSDSSFTSSFFGGWGGGDGDSASFICKRGFKCSSLSFSI